MNDGHYTANDEFANINTAVIGAYDRPKVRLSGAGGAPEIAASAKEVLIVLRQSRRTFVEKVEFVTSAGFLDGGEELGLAFREPDRRL